MSQRHKKATSQFELNHKTSIKFVVRVSETHYYAGSTRVKEQGVSSFTLILVLFTLETNQINALCTAHHISGGGDVLICKVSACSFIQNDPGAPKRRRRSIRRAPRQEKRNRSQDQLAPPSWLWSWCFLGGLRTRVTNGYTNRKSSCYSVVSSTPRRRLLEFVSSSVCGPWTLESGYQFWVTMTGTFFRHRQAEK